MPRTKPDIFIIESLNPDDEGNGRFEGSIISNLLRLHGKHPKYRYVRTSSELKKAIKEFGRSTYRYLHISAHGDKNGMCTTNQDEINYEDLANMLTPHFTDKRLFLSACSMVHKNMAASLIPKTNCYSVAGPIDNIDFHRAAIFWASFYHLMFLKDAKKFNHSQVTETLQKTAQLFEVNMRSYHRADNDDGFAEDSLYSPVPIKSRKKAKDQRGADRV